VRDFPFLKSRTIQRRLRLMESWYLQWPAFAAELEVAYEKEGFKYLVVSDIASYFENIDLQLLRDLLLQHLPGSPRLVTFLIWLLEYWAWPSPSGPSAPRGIPQGNEVSSFLGNLYLLPLDQEVTTFAKRNDVKYLRYVDDVKIMTKDFATARQALFLMNRSLRGLRLTIQGAKTRIYEGEDIKGQFFDSRLDEANAVIEAVIKKPPKTAAAKEIYAKRLKALSKQCGGRRSTIRDKDLRLFRRLITGFSFLKDSGLVSMVLNQIERNPDAMLLRSAVQYLRTQSRNQRRIAERVVGLLKKGELLFPYQEANLLLLLRYLRAVPDDGWKVARKRLMTGSIPYVRQQAALLLGQQSWPRPELRRFEALLSREADLDVQRAICGVLTQLPHNDFARLVVDLCMSMERKLQRLGRMYRVLGISEQRGKEQIASIFRNFDENIALERIAELEVLSRSQQTAVKTKLQRELRRVRSRVRRPLLKERWNRLEKVVAAGLAGSGA
jgi:hypothetical protein